MSTTITSLAGLQEKIVADSTAMFRTSSDLFNAVYSENAGNASLVQFSTRNVPSSTTAQSENVNVTPTTVSISAVNATLETYPILARVSNLSWESPNAPMKVAQALAGGIARTVDTAITDLFTGFSVSAQVNSFSISSIFYYSALLDATGFIGDKVAVLHPLSFASIANSLIGVSSTKQEEILSRGYVTTLGNVDIYVSPWVKHSTTANDYAWNGIYFKEALGLGYRDPVIDIKLAPNLPAVAQDVLGVAYFKTANLTNGAGIALDCKL